MPKTLEELKKILSEEEAALIIKASREQLSRMEQTAFDKLKERLTDEEGLDALPSVDQLEQLQKMYLKTKPYTAESTSDEVAKKIFANFAKEFGEENIKNKALHFPDDEKNVKANKFFSEQAEKGHAFLFKQNGCDNYAFSDGKGHYKMGSKAEIISYCEQNSLATPPVLKAEQSAEQTSSPVMNH